MASFDLSPSPSDTMQCPVCRAVQPWSDACRRCKCDLSLLRSVDRAFRASLGECLRLLRDGQPEAALEVAQYADQLRPDADTARLLAVCRRLCAERFAARAAGLHTATEAAKDAEEDEVAAVLSAPAAATLPAVADSPPQLTRPTSPAQSRAPWHVAGSVSLAWPGVPQHRLGMR